MTVEQNQQTRELIHTIFTNLPHDPEYIINLIDNLKSLHEKNTTGNMLEKAIAVTKISMTYFDGIARQITWLYKQYEHDEYKLFVGLIRNGLLEELKQFDKSVIMQVSKHVTQNNILPNHYKELISQGIDLIDKLTVIELNCLGRFVANALEILENPHKKSVIELLTHDPNQVEILHKIISSHQKKMSLIIDAFMKASPENAQVKHANKLGLNSEDIAHILDRITHENSLEAVVTYLEKPTKMNFARAVQDSKLMSLTAKTLLDKYTNIW